MRFDKWTDDNQSNRNILHHYHVHFHKIDHEVLISIQQNIVPHLEQIVRGLLRYTKKYNFSDAKRWKLMICKTVYMVQESSKDMLHMRSLWEKLKSIS